MAPSLQAFLLSRLLTAGFAQDTKGLGNVELHCRLPNWSSAAGWPGSPFQEKWHRTESSGDAQ